MKEKKAELSMRTSLFIMLLVVLIGLSTLVIVGFRQKMVELLLDAEKTHVNQMGNMIDASVNSAVENMKNTVDSWSKWDEIYKYVSDKNQEFIENNFTKGSESARSYDFILIKDMDSKDIYTHSFLPSTSRSALPSGLSDAVSELSRNVIDKYNSVVAAAGNVRFGEFGNAEKRALGVNDINITGIFMCNSVAYVSSTAYITNSADTAGANGTLTFIEVLDQSYLSSLTNMTNTVFTVLPASEIPEIPFSTSIESSDRIVFRSYKNDLLGNAVSLNATTPRIIYEGGMKAINATISVFYLIIFLMVFLFFFLVQKNIIKRFERLNRDVSALSGDKRLQLSDYGRYKEINSLGTEINALLRRIEDDRLLAEKAEMSMSILQNIMNSMDSYIYVSDIDTDEILFVNDKMREHFKLGDNYNGKICWQVFQDGFTSRCEFCPIPKLKNDPEGVVVWEEHNTVTGKYYKNVDRLINWANGKLVHLQHSTDITELKEAEAALQKRLEQQELTATLSRSFISNDDVTADIKEALKIIGEFMNISRTLIIRAEGNYLNSVYEWRNENEVIEPRLGRKTELRQIEIDIIKSFANKKITYLDLADIGGEDIIKTYSLNVKNAIFFPLFMGDTFWGLIEFDKCTEFSPWNASEINLGDMIAGIISGVINRKHIEDQLESISSIVKSAPQFIALISDDRSYRYINDACEAQTGYSKEELIHGGGMTRIFSEETLNDIFKKQVPLVKKMGKVSFECPLIHKDKGEIIMSFSVFNIEGRIGGIGIIGMDITEIRMMEKELIQAKDLAEEGSRAKSEFLSRMSHEMRTPMNAIIGMTNIARSSENPERKEYCLEKISDASEHLLGVINDILDMSKIEANKLEISCSDYILKQMINHVIGVLNFKMDEKKLKFELEIDKNLPEIVFGDEQHLKQVLSNLLTNAIKFTPENGRIKLRVSLLETNNKTLRVLFEVSDTGIGISPEQQQKLFRSFEQADGSISRKYGGTGLGLAISKRIVELMGGRISLKSEPGLGSTFSFEVSMEISGKQMLESNNSAYYGAARDASVLEQRYHGLKIILAEDVEINREIACTLLEETGLTIDCAVNGSEAVKLFCESGEKYSLILMDVQMPEMDGLEATRVIRSSDMPEAEDIPIVAMTANAFNEDIINCINAGMNDHIAKPVEIEKLISVLDKYLL